MEFCSEVAVLESAFQFIEEKVVTGLADLPKELCAKAAGIVQVAVEEICAGLEQDNEPEERVQWSQKCHTLIIYRLITAKYNKTEKLPEGCVPRMTTLDTLSHAIPAFSVHLYFEVVKLCRWEQLFVDSLSYLDPIIAVQLLQEAVTHCRLVPCAMSDTQLIVTIMENLITSLLQSTSPTNNILQLLLSTVRKQTTFIQTVYPEDYDRTAHNDNNKLVSADRDIEQNKMSTEFWCLFLKDNPDFLSYGLECYSNSCPSVNPSESKETNQQTSISTERCDFTESRLAQLLFIWYAVHLTSGKSDWDKWFIYNVGVRSKDCGNMVETAAYSLNYPLLDCLTQQCPKDQLLTCIHKCLIYVHTTTQERQKNREKVKEGSDKMNSDMMKEHRNTGIDSRNAQENDTENLKYSEKVENDTEELYTETLQEEGNVVVSSENIEEKKTENPVNSARLKKDTGVCPVSFFNLVEIHDPWCISKDVYIIRNIIINTSILLRMFIGTTSSVGSPTEAEQCIQLVQQLLVELRSKVKAGQESTVDFMTDVDGNDDDEVLLADSWEKDVSLSVLLWRISSEQPQSEACLEELLSDRCLQFWYFERVYNVLENIKPVLWSTKRVLQLFEIAEFVEGNSSRETTHKMKALIVAVFSELSFPNQDQIIMTQYQKMPEGWVIFQADSTFMQKTTNVFNKLTADHSNQIQVEVLQLCLTDPLSIARTAVEMCVRNEDQAISSAKVLQLLCKTCSCKHKLYHPEMSLICSVVSKFVTSVKLTAKEEKNFLTFITLLIQSATSGHVLMSPIELLSTTIIPYTSVADFKNRNCLINFNFTLSLLQTALSASCNKNCDWSASDLEPVVLVTVLAQILDECVVLWEGVDSGLQSGDVLDGEECVFSLPEKVTLREKTSKCLDTLCHMIETGLIDVPDQHLNWMLQETGSLHWSVQYRLVPILEACGYTQTIGVWQDLIQECAVELEDNLVFVLMLVSLDAKLANTIEPACIIDCSTIVTALTQIWPNVLLSEFENVVVFLERLVSSGNIHISYRLSSPTLVPLTALSATGFHQLLGLSQLLRDIVLTLTLCCHGDETSHLQMLRHIVQGYVAVIKERCESASLLGDSQQFILSQMFVHVCDITEHLPSAATELTWVLLLHMVTKVRASCHSDKVSSGSHSNTVKDGVNMDPSMFEAVYKLPQCEERDMIVKKLRK